MPHPTTHHNGVPTEVRFETGQLPTGQAATIPIYTFDNLEQMNLLSLRNKAKFLVGRIGERALPPLPALRDEIIGWIVDVQIKACTARGIGGVTPRHLGVPANWETADDQNFFGGDGQLPSCADNYRNSTGLPMEKLQPLHRGLSFVDNMHVNRIEAANGFQQSRARNEHGHFYNGGFQM
eukprot:CAMPEP_0115832792 /NCGR_PEP_ID=MMETSP0287-20121206/2841_1 /TAXON_ID=412157 /ORGANISM="Chrysochromulina rotalis, Strain UIO044" /LENGTH=179 /DNA_ID=CAMNT_0003286189 /DNA_START=34 /DNA_END=573 /DNA_ORIENTATION=-